MSLVASTKQWTAPELTKTACTQRPSAHFVAGYRPRGRILPWVKRYPYANFSRKEHSILLFYCSPSRFVFILSPDLNFSDILQMSFKKSTIFEEEQG